MACKLDFSKIVLVADRRFMSIFIVYGLFLGIIFVLFGFGLEFGRWEVYVFFLEGEG